MNSFEDDFRSDGKRAACIDCDATVNMKHGESLRECLERHYKEKHSQIWTKAISYCNFLDNEIEAEFGIKNATSAKGNVL